MSGRRRWLVLAIAIGVLATALLLLRRGGDTSVGDQAVPEHSASRTRIGSHEVAGDGRHIAGIVLLEGAPAASAQVRLVRQPDVGNEQRALTNSDGRFDFGPETAAEYVVVAELPRAMGAARRIDLRDPASDSEQLRLMIHACTSAVYGSIHDANGNAIADARITVDDGAHVESDEHGEYEICVPKDDVAIRVAAQGFAQLVSRVAAFGRVRRDLVLLPEAIVTGTVVRADDRKPVADATIEIVSDDLSALDQPRSLFSSTDSDGHFHVDGLWQGRYLVFARAEHLATNPPVSIVADVGKANDVVCELARTLVLSGKVVEHGTGVGGVALEMVGPRSPTGSQRAITATDGSFTIDGVQPGTYVPTIRGYSLEKKQFVTVRDRDPDKMVIAVEHGGSISGRIVRDREPVDGAQVSTDGAFEISDHDGRFTLVGLSPGDHVVYAESKRTGAFATGPKVSLTKGEAKRDIEIDLDLAASISGMVVDQTGAPVTDAVVRFGLLHGHDGATAATGSDGVFAATALSGGGSYLYEVQSQSGTNTYPPAQGKQFPPVAVADGRTRVTGLRIKVRVDRRSITGRALDAMGEPVVGAAIAATREDSRQYLPPGTTARSNLHGEFELPDLAEGNYTVFVEHVRGITHVEHVAAGRHDLEVRLPALGRIAGTLVGFTSAPRISGIGEESARAVQASVRGATFAFRDLAPGKYWLTARAAHEIALSTVIVPAGGEVNVALTAQGLGAITGTVRDEKSGEPVANADCTCAGYEAKYATTDASGAFRIDDIGAGPVRIECYGSDTVFGNATVIADQTVHVDLAMRVRPPRRRGHAGLVLEQQLSEVIVDSVEPGGPAARAGVLPGDVVRAIDGEPVPGEYAIYAIERHEIGTAAKLTLERGDQQLQIAVTIEASR